MIIFRPVLLLLAAVRLAAAAAPVADLGQGLNYVRLHTSEEAATVLAPAAAGGGSLIIDLRYPTDGLNNPDAVRSALAKHSPGLPVFLLVSPETPAGVAFLVKSLAEQTVTLGATGSWVPDKHGVLVEQTPEADRLAYAAFESGQPVATLIAGKIDKDRYDESTLMTEFRGGNTDPQPPPEPDPTKPKPAAEASDKPAPTDRVLQRAVHLHRALLALPHRS